MAHIVLTYTQHDLVTICDNSTLQSREFRYDKLHLKTDGVRIFASNLKYAIAGAIGIRVIKKTANRHSKRRYDSDDNYEEEWQPGRSTGYRYRGSRW